MRRQIYRIQDNRGIGPFQTRSLRYEAFRLGALPWEFFGWGCRDLEGIAEISWSEAGQQELTQRGFSVVMIEADRVIWEYADELLFACRRPLYQCAVRLPWPPADSTMYMLEILARAAAMTLDELTRDNTIAADVRTLAVAGQIDALARASARLAAHKAKLL